MLQTYEGYIENGRFYPKEDSVNLKKRRDVKVIFLDEPEEEVIEEIKSWDDFFRIAKELDEEDPHFFDDFLRPSYFRKINDVNED